MDVGNFVYAACRHGTGHAHAANGGRVSNQEQRVGKLGHAHACSASLRVAGERSRAAIACWASLVAAEGVHRRRLRFDSKRLAAAGDVARRASSSSSSSGIVCGYSEVSMGGRTASMWTPLQGDGAMEVHACREYSIKFSWQKLPHYILGLQLGGGSDQVQLQPAQGVVNLPSEQQSGPELRPTKQGVVIAHGLLCSRLDFANVAEQLCKDGLLVIAPEFDDSVSHDEGVTAGGFIGALAKRKPAEEQRAAVVEECIEYLRAQGVEHVGLLGHSRGGVTISQMPGRFARVNIAGFLPPPIAPRDGYHPSASSAPMLIVCGAEDEVCARPPSSLEYVRAVVDEMAPEAEEWYPEGIGHLTVLDPRVRQQWAAKLGSVGLGGLARPPPEGSDFDKVFVDRIVEFFKRNLPSLES